MESKALGYPIHRGLLCGGVSAHRRRGPRPLGGGTMVFLLPWLEREQHRDVAGADPV